jgi:2-C-methyl-D-erythritol 4-phosphate cytidylyltransferase
VLVAAGKGLRLGAPMPKQFLPLEGRPLFSYSLRLFDSLPFVSQIVLVLPEGGVPPEQEGELARVRKPLACVTGGARRQDSTAAGLAALSEHYDVALVHDAARPFPEPAAVEALVKKTMECGGGLLAMPSPDTVKRAAPDGTVAETIDRSTIWLAQTPQAIRADLVGRAIAAFRDPACNVTDEASLLELWGVRVALVESSSQNFKVTRPADLASAEAILARMREKVMD